MIMFDNNLDRTERFTFGKYTGKLIQNICVTDLNYIIWLGNDVSRFKLSYPWQKFVEKIRNDNKPQLMTTYVRR